eukprot:366496-Chlamydomonas_euryale.AAC.35
MRRPGTDRVTPRREPVQGADLSRHVHIGWGVMGGAALIGFCMIASAATQVCMHGNSLTGICSPCVNFAT